ncbi:hypothetical protein QYE76_003691 [Lolium multiflorum]|uniref:Uncharacterized protein n=1 Tax=Lolium multiflorum TaxID=4521 RepID=A0AAD8RP74_LOLMU|nr:hypothetical protein QYE76_003691 [Lolium multiflorum]
MMAATVLEASARMAEVSTPSRFTFVDTFRHGIFLLLFFSSLLLALSACGSVATETWLDEEEKNPDHSSTLYAILRNRFN